MGFPLPLWPFFSRIGLWGICPVDYLGSLTFPLILSESFSPLQSFTILGPSSLSFPWDNCLPCGFIPFDVFPALDSHIPSKITIFWVTVPSQCFSHSQGFHPSKTCWSYFIPVPSLGFTLQGCFPYNSWWAFSNHLPSCGLHLVFSSSLSILWVSLS